MESDPKKPPRNRDLEQPRRTGETIQPTMPPERGQNDRERNAPLPEEETYERDAPDRHRGNLHASGGSHRR